MGNAESALKATNPEPFKGIRPEILLLMGPPQIGRKAQAMNLERKFGYTYLSMSNLVKMEEEKASHDGKRIMKLKSKGRIIPSDLLGKLLIKRMDHFIKQNHSKFLIYGFPVNIDNFNAWKLEIEKYCDVKGAVVLEASKEFVIRRILEATTEKRNHYLESYELFINKTLYIADYYESQGQIVKVNAEQDPDVVSKELEQKLASQFNEVITGPKPSLLFVLGGPGSGKGTQCEYIENTYGYGHISTGDLLREECTKDTETSQTLKELMSEGKLVPTSLLINLMRDKIMELNSIGKNKILLDGFPRNMENIEVYNNELADKVNLLGVLYFECSEECMTQRILFRAQTSDRADDNEETIKHRFETFQNQSLPVVAKLEEQGVTIYRVDANKEVEEVSNSVKEVIENAVPQRTTYLVLMRNGEDDLSVSNGFVGWKDVPLNETGESHSINAGKMLGKSNIPLDAGFTCCLGRSIKSLHLALDEASYVHIPITKSWELNPQHLGILQGEEKASAEEKYPDMVAQLSTDFTAMPPVVDDVDESIDRRYDNVDKELLPKGESLELAERRIMSYYEENIKKLLKNGKNVILCCPESTIKLIAKSIDGISNEDIMNVHIPYSNPLIYHFNSNVEVMPFEDASSPLNGRYLLSATEQPAEEAPEEEQPAEGEEVPADE